MLVYRCRRRVLGSSITNATGLAYNVPHYSGAGRLAGRDAQPDRTLVKEADFEVVGEWKLHLRPSRAAAAKLAKSLGDVTLEPYAYEISCLGSRRDAARAPQCSLESQ